MTYKWARKLVLLKAEVTYATDPTPEGTNALVMYDVEYDREYSYTPAAKRATPWLARSRSDVAAKFGRLKGWVEMAGSGTAGTAPAWGLIPRICAFAETVTAATDVAYTPVSTGEESASGYWNLDGQLHKVFGMRGMATAIRFPANDLPRFQFEALGLPQAPSDTALATPDFSAWKSAIVVNKVNTPTFTLHGYAGVLQDLTINMGTALGGRDLVGANDVRITDREPVGTITIEKPTIAAKNFYSIIDANTRGALQVIHGSTAGSIVQLDCPAVQLTNPRDVNINGTVYLTMDIGLDPDDGNDEITITVK